ncbi:unnamed protein product, partial [Linum tenue]
KRPQILFTKKEKEKKKPPNPSSPISSFLIRSEVALDLKRKFILELTTAKSKLPYESQLSSENKAPPSDYCRRNKAPPPLKAATSLQHSSCQVAAELNAGESSGADCAQKEIQAPVEKLLFEVERVRI